MIENFSNLYKSLIHKKMKKFNLKSKTLLSTALFLTSGLTILSHSNPVKHKVDKSVFDFKLNFFIFLWIRDLYKFEKFSIIRNLQLYL
jgi:hypothetical protein